MQQTALLASIAFLAALTTVGVWHARRIKTGVDFALAGRRLPLGVVVGTLVATWIGTGSIFGNAEKAYEHQWLMFVLPIPGALGILALAALAGRARELPADSVPQLLAIRFGRAAQLIGAVALVGAYLVIVSYQYRAGAAVVSYMQPQLAVLTEPADASSALVDEQQPNLRAMQFVCIAGFAVFVILYTVLAGMVSVAWTDLVNGVLMTIGILMALALLCYQAWQSDASALPVVSNLSEPVPPITPITWVGMLLPTFLLVLGDANLYQRFMSARSPREARWAAVLMFFGVLLLEWSIIGLACLGRMLLPEEPANHGYTIVAIAFTLLPDLLGIVLVMSVLAVIVTTADSFLLGAATSVSADLHRGLTSARRQRIVVVILGLIAIGVALTSDKFFDVAIYAYTLYGVTLTPAIVAALVFPQTPPRAVVIGMAAGLTTAVLWKAMLYFDFMPSGLSQVDPVLPALGANLAPLIAISFIARRSSGSQAQ